MKAVGSKLQYFWSSITKAISGILNAMTSTKEDKFCILFFVSQVGDFKANMNEPSVKGESYITHSCVLVAREVARRIEGKNTTERDYFWYKTDLLSTNSAIQTNEVFVKWKFGPQKRSESDIW